MSKVKVYRCDSPSCPNTETGSHDGPPHKWIKALIEMNAGPGLGFIAGDFCKIDCLQDAIIAVDWGRRVGP